MIPAALHVLKRPIRSQRVPPSIAANCAGLSWIGIFFNDDAYQFDSGGSAIKGIFAHSQFYRVPFRIRWKIELIAEVIEVP